MNNIAGALYRVIKIKNEMKCSRRMRSVRDTVSRSRISVTIANRQNDRHKQAVNLVFPGLHCR